MATITVRYLKWRDGRPRWEPGPGLRDKGWPGRDLKDDAGQWLGLEAAIVAAEALNREADAWRDAGKPRRKPQVPIKPQRTCEHLFDIYFKSPAFAELASSTQRDYRSKAGVFLASEFGDAPVAALDQPALHGYWEELYRERGHHMANGVLAVVRAALSYAVLKGWRGDNPAKQLGISTPPPRLVVWTAAEIAHLVTVAERLGQPSIADAVVVALHTGQRQADVLTLAVSRIDAGRAFFRQAKTGKPVRVPATPALVDRIALIRSRWQAGADNVVRIPATLITRDTDGQAYSKYDFRHKFAAVRAVAAKTMPSLADKLFLDLRDTAVTRLALAGATLAEICSITGHTYETAQQIMKHYLAIDDSMAKAAIDRLTAWMAAEGIAI